MINFGNEPGSQLLVAWKQTAQARETSLPARAMLQISTEFTAKRNYHPLLPFLDSEHTAKRLPSSTRSPSPIARDWITRL